jgi:hypothetical protein
LGRRVYTLAVGLGITQAGAQARLTALKTGLAALLARRKRFVNLDLLHAVVCDGRRGRRLQRQHAR